jgi:hypothetical protein
MKILLPSAEAGVKLFATSVYCLVYFFTLKMEAVLSIHGVTAQKTALYINTSVKGDMFAMLKAHARFLVS